MSFGFRPAKREQVGLLLGLAGASGSGKTYSALRLASGMTGGQPFAVIDTEAGRAKHYADAFKFDHGDLTPPFTPDRYLEAIIAAQTAGYGVTVVDSMSHEHAGDGGLLDMQEAELQRMAGDDWKRREACRMASWIKPKMAHKKMVAKLLQLRSHLILCFRAEERIEMRKNAEGKIEVVPKASLTGLHGWMPVSEKTLPYELTASFLLTPDRPGIPQPIKLQEQHRPFFTLTEPIGEHAGERLAEWARGGQAVPARESGAGATAASSVAPPPADRLESFVADAAAGFEGLGSLAACKQLWERIVGSDTWRTLTTAQQTAVINAKDRAKQRIGK